MHGTRRKYIEVSEIQGKKKIKLRRRQPRVRSALRKSMTSTEEHFEVSMLATMVETVLTAATNMLLPMIHIC